jgi:hypothetical protein
MCQTNTTDATRRGKHLDKIATDGLKRNSFNLPLNKKKIGSFFVHFLSFIVSFVG